MKPEPTDDSWKHGKKARKKSFVLIFHYSPADQITYKLFGPSRTEKYSSEEAAMEAFSNFLHKKNHQSVCVPCYIKDFVKVELIRPDGSCELLFEKNLLTNPENSL